MSAANELPSADVEDDGEAYEWEEWKRRFPWAIPAPSYDHAGRVVFGHVGSPTFPTEPDFCERAPEDEGKPFPNVGRRPRSKGYRRGAE